MRGWTRDEVDSLSTYQWTTDTLTAWEASFEDPQIALVADMIRKVKGPPS